MVIVISSMLVHTSMVLFVEQCSLSAESHVSNSEAKPGCCQCVLGLRKSCARAFEEKIGEMKGFAFFDLFCDTFGRIVCLRKLPSLFPSLEAESKTPVTGPLHGIPAHKTRVVELEWWVGEETRPGLLRSPSLMQAVWADPRG
jgi:hypothetical protein